MMIDTLGTTMGLGCEVCQEEMLTFVKPGQDLALIGQEFVDVETDTIHSAHYSCGIDVDGWREFDEDDMSDVENGPSAREWDEAQEELAQLRLRVVELEAEVRVLHATGTFTW